MRTILWGGLALCFLGSCGDKPVPLPTSACTSPPGDKGQGAEGINYNRDMVTLLQRCSGCHGPDSPEGGVRYDNYKDAKANGVAAVGAVLNGTMPPSGPLPDEDRCQYYYWQLNSFAEDSGK